MLASGQVPHMLKGYSTSQLLLFGHVAPTEAITCIHMPKVPQIVQTRTRAYSDDLVALWVAA